MTETKQEIELDLPIREESGPDGRKVFVSAVNPAAFKGMLPSLIKIAAVELARRDHDAKRMIT